MLSWLGKVVAEKLAGMAIFLLAAGIVVLGWLYHDRLPSLAEIGSFVGRCLIWMAAAALLPWATFFLVGWASKAESNSRAAALLAGWAAIDGGLAWWLHSGQLPAAAAWTLVILAVLLGGLYNLIAANQIADRLGRR